MRIGTGMSASNIQLRPAPSHDIRFERQYSQWARQLMLEYSFVPLPDIGLKYPLADTVTCASGSAIARW